jgi:glucosamine--fructose-6-phosphate aminotransferase (isomerizing)
MHLKALVEECPLEGTTGISHTRWATHGAATEHNAHPHSNTKIAVVHNGIIENFAPLRQELQGAGYTFESETDTEVVVHLLEHHLQETADFQAAFQKTLGRLRGAFALAILYAPLPQTLFFARQGSPLVIGQADEEWYVASDALSFSTWTNTACYLEEGDFGTITKSQGGFEKIIFNQQGNRVERPLTKTSFTSDSATKADFSHFMLKEIHEQPTVLSDVLQSFLPLEATTVHFPTFDFDWQNYDRISIIACGTSYFAGCVAKYWFEQYGGLAVDVEIASEYRYRHPVFPDRTLYVVISQSGETIDTLHALRYVQKNNKPVLALVNVPHSSIAREATYCLQTLAGPEIGVASTKAFTAQLMLLAGLCLQATQKRGRDTKMLHHTLKSVPGLMSHVLRDTSIYKTLAKQLVEAKHALYLGRGTLYPIAHEGALKLKEISYIHAEAYAAGELKHGPIALIDSTMPVVILSPHNEWFEKSLSNMQEVLARGARVICLTDTEGEMAIKKQVQDDVYTATLPKTHSFTEPFVLTLAVQLLAYYVALLKGTDIDQPRNLAKSVTVE